MKAMLLHRADESAYVACLRGHDQRFPPNGRQPEWAPSPKKTMALAAFGPNAVAILLEAYEGLVAELGLKAIEEKERAAKLILRLAQGQTDLTP